MLNGSLHFAAENGDIAHVTELLKQGADVNAKDEKGETPLHKAVWATHNSEHIVGLLLEHGAEVDPQGMRKITPLYWSIWIANHAVAEVLLRHGANVNFRICNGETLLHTAMSLHHRDIVELLLEYGIDVNAKNTNGITAMDKARMGGLMCIVQLLETFEKGSEVYENWIITEKSDNADELMAKRKDGKLSKQEMHTFFNPWGELKLREAVKYTSYLQWLPRECMEGTLELKKLLPGFDAAQKRAQYEASLAPIASSEKGKEEIDADASTVKSASLKRKREDDDGPSSSGTPAEKRQRSSR